ncbi:Receptor-type tyrosine-protein phosphatase beta [Frankliniella fusca]|uniref:protein-tyrosine-phosphatase n=1 Tax=Frankliniella fusca TaxID=407009 RepID=A0AAE1LPQ1_9NEOP|nr:Receptor-type tyrosine-protein phosphatase beta [Frankliniella fusca]
MLLGKYMGLSGWSRARAAQTDSVMARLRFRTWMVIHFQGACAETNPNPASESEHETVQCVAAPVRGVQMRCDSLNYRYVSDIEDFEIMSVGWQSVTVMFTKLSDPLLTYYLLLMHTTENKTISLTCGDKSEGNHCTYSHTHLQLCTEYNVKVIAYDKSSIQRGSSKVKNILTFRYPDSGFHVSRSGNNIEGHWDLPSFGDDDFVKTCVYSKYVVEMYLSETNYKLNSSETAVNPDQSETRAFAFSFPLEPHCKWITYRVEISLAGEKGSRPRIVYRRPIAARYEPRVATLAAVYTHDYLLVRWRVGEGENVECLRCVRIAVNVHEGEAEDNTPPPDPGLVVAVRKAPPATTATVTPYRDNSRSEKGGIPSTCPKPVEPLIFCDGTTVVPVDAGTTTTSDSPASPPTPASSTPASSTSVSPTPVRPPTVPPSSKPPAPVSSTLTSTDSTEEDVSAESGRPEVHSQAPVGRPRPRRSCLAPTAPALARVPSGLPGRPGRLGRRRRLGRLTNVALRDTYQRCTYDRCEPELRKHTKLQINVTSDKLPWSGFCMEESFDKLERIRNTPPIPPKHNARQYTSDLDFNTISLSLPSSSGSLQQFEVAAWSFGVGDDNVPFANGLCANLVPFKSGPVIDSKRVRMTEAELTWRVEGASSLDSFNISVVCMDVAQPTPTPTYVFVVGLVRGDEKVTVLVTGLHKSREYECRAKLSAGASESTCSLRERFLTSSQAQIAKNFSVDGKLEWLDTLNGYNKTSYLVMAARKEPPPSCCQGAVEQSNVYEFESDRDCCSNLDELLPAGTPFTVTVEPIPASVVYYEPIDVTIRSDSIPLPADLSLSEPPTAARSHLLRVLVCPPCEAFGSVTHYRFSASSSDGSAGSAGVTRLKAVEEMAMDQTTGVLSLSFTSLFPSFNWCQCGGQTVTFTVVAVNMNENKSSEARELTVDVSETCPDVASDKYWISAFDVQVEPSGRRALVHINEDFFNADDQNKLPLSYRILVAEKGFEDMSTGCAAATQTIHSWSEAQCEHVQLYSPVEHGWNPFVDCKIFGLYNYTLGEEVLCPKQKSQTFCNGPLRLGTTYAVRLRAVYDTEGLYYVETPSVYFRAEDSEIETCFYYYSVALIALAVVALCFVCSYCSKHHTCSLSCTLGRRGRSRSGRLGGEVLSRLVWFRWPPWGPAPEGDASCARADAYRGQGVPPCGDRHVGVPPPYTLCMFRALPPPCHMAPQLQREFEALCALSAQYAAGAPSRTGHLPQNACKNRYCNIIPFERTRVRLSGTTDDDIANYINASYVAGYSGRTEYIASQGPKESTTKDFWFMVYEQNVRLIIMLTKLMEDGKTKCHQYYPELGDRYMWGDLAVECSVQNDLPTYTLRTIVLHKGAEQRLVHHLHFLDWPDFGCPASSVHVLQFCRTVRRHALLFPGLMVVHCSAGVGRTGTLIAVDILLQRLKAKKKLDIFGVVMRLREQRPFMVQCQEQYTFIYKCLKAAVEERNSKVFRTPFPIPVEKNTYLNNGLQMVKQSILSSWKK